MKLNLSGPFAEPSGYGEFARFFAYSLANSGADITCENITLASSLGKPIDFGIKGDLVKSKLTISPKKHDVNIVFMIPPLFKAYKRKQADINIGFTMFEADSLPANWVSMCNDMDAIFVPSKWNATGFRKSGVTKPIYEVPAGIVEAEIDSSNTVLKNDKFTFYSIFQWSERKNPIGLLKAYFVAMQGKTDVQLILKTYVDSRFPNNKERILFEIEKIKRELKLPSYPDLVLITDFLTNKEISNLHKSSNCFVTPHRAEGWNMPAMEAMAYGNSVIATNYSGNTAFMNDGVASLISFFETPCVTTDGMAPFFNGSMMWAEPNISELISSMKLLYQNRGISDDIGESARRHILENFNEKTSSMSIMNALSAFNSGKRYQYADRK